MTFKQLLIIVLLLLSKVIFAQLSSNKHGNTPSLMVFLPKIVLFDSTKTVDFTAKTSFYIDETNVETIEGISAKQFLPNNKSEYDFHFTPNTVWIKFEIDSKLQREDNFVLQVRNWFMDVADLYYQENKKPFKTLASGDNIPFSTKEIKSKYPSMLLRIKPQTTSVFYLKLRNTQYFNFKLNLIQSVYFFQYQESGSSKDLISGLILMRFAFHLSLLFFMFKDMKFRAFSFWGILLCFIYYFSSGYAAYIFPNSPYLTNLAFFVSVSFAPIVLTYYIYIIFELKEKIPQIKPLYYFFACVGLVNLAINPFIQHAYITRIYITFMAFFVFFHFISAIWFYFKISKPSIWYVITLIIYLPTFTFYYARNAGLINYTGQFNVIQLTFFVDFMMIPFIIAATLRQSNHEKMNFQTFFMKKKIEAEKLQEMDALKTHFFTNISHELRTPLTLITAPIQELLGKYPSDNLLPLMNRNAQRLLTLINQLLDISKLEAGQMNVEMSQNNVSKYLKTLVSSFTSLAESKKIAFQFTQNQAEVLGYIDQDKTDKVITNLLSNAFKFTSEGGKVSVDCQFSGDLKNLIITITDSGIGISKEKLSKIFDRFYQVDSTQNRHFEGTGIGLALVKELVGVLKGEINVMSQEGQGTTFVVKLPIDYETWKEEISIKSVFPPVVGVPTDRLVEISNNQSFISVVGVPTDHRMEIPNNQQDILLIVDDNADIRAYIRSVFESSYQIIEAINGKDGIQKAQETTPNLIISDLMMPEMDGFEFCKYLKTNETTSHIPVIMLTAKADIESRIEGLELGADDYLIKPFNAKEIQARVKNLLDKQENLRQYFTGKSSETQQEIPKNVIIENVFLKKAKNILEKHLSKNSFGVEQFCQEINMSSSQLLRKLKALTNQTTVEFVREYRLQRAAEMLVQRNSTVSDVAFAVGFESLSYFTKAFQEKFGILPSEYVWKTGSRNLKMG